MVEININGMEELRQELVKAADKYPDIAQESLEAVGKKFKNEVIKETYSAVDKKTGNLAKGYKLDPVRGYGRVMRIDFRATASHFHLIENGHEKVTQKTREGRKAKNGGKNIGFVPGKLIVSKIREEYKAKFPAEIEKALTKLLKESGLNS